MLTIIADGFKSASARTLVKNAVLENKKCVLLVPEQETLSAEAEMALTLSPSFPLFLEVTNFSRLANTVFRKLGGVCYRYANDAAEALLMWKSLDALAPLLHVPRSDASAVEEMLRENGVENCSIRIIDRGALECVIRARVETAILRGKGEN